MTHDKIKSLIISDLVKLDTYNAQLNGTGPSKTEDIYQIMSLEDLKKLHGIITKHMTDYRTLGNHYPSVIESLEYTNEEIEHCISNYKHEKKEELRNRMNLKNADLNQDVKEDLYCDACHQAPCMCSDRESSSTIQDF